MARRRPALALARRLLDGRLGLCPVLRHLWASSLATGLRDLPPAAAAVACALAARDDGFRDDDQWAKTALRAHAASLLDRLEGCAAAGGVGLFPASARLDVAGASTRAEAVRRSRLGARRGVP